MQTTNNGTARAKGRSSHRHPNSEVLNPLPSPLCAVSLPETASPAGGNSRRKFAGLSASVALLAILLTVAAIQRIEVANELPTTLHAVVIDGRLYWTNKFAREDQSIASIAANRPTTILVSSSDYVYTVQQPETNLSVVVLPGQSASLPVRLDEGTWPLKTLTGCGGTFDRHRPLLLKALR